MIQYKNNDYRAWPHCYNFVAYNKEFLETKYNDLKMTLFTMFISNLKSYYQKFKSDDYVLYKYYEGVTFQYNMYLEKLWSPYYFKGLLSLTKTATYEELNQYFDYDYLIQRLEKELSSFLSKAEENFKDHNNGSAAFFIGRYFGAKEFIKVCKIYKNKFVIKEN